MRVKFEAQLERLNVELITMGALCEEVISGAAKAAAGAAAGGPGSAHHLLRPEDDL